MKHFSQYLVESKKTFDYRIKIAGDVSSDTMTEFEKKLAQFDVVKMSSAKTTPVTKVVKDFPKFANERVTYFDVTFNYPATSPQIEQIAKLLGMDPNKVIMQQQEYAEQIDSEKEAPESPLLGSDYEDTNAEQQAAKDEHSAEPSEHEAVVKNEYKSDFTIAGGKTPKAKTTNDFPQQTKSPIGGTNKIPDPYNKG